MEIVPGSLTRALANIRLRSMPRSQYENHTAMIAAELSFGNIKHDLESGEVCLVIASVDCNDERSNDLFILSKGHQGWISSENVSPVNEA